MFTVAVANTKGGSGKTTVATHIASSFATRGYTTGLADMDRQKSSLNWLKRRPHMAAHIIGIYGKNGLATLPKLDRLVVDCPAALERSVVQDIVNAADLIVIPVLASAFDEDGTLRFLKHLKKMKPIQKNKRTVAFVANRVRPRTNALKNLEDFLDLFEYPVIGKVRDSSQYSALAGQGYTMFDMPQARYENFRQDWSDVMNFVEQAVRNRFS
jgi:chromosome partitioning protein